jgi:hypothetical protein
MTVRYPDGTTEQIPLSARSTRITRRLTAPPGESVVRFETNAPRPPGNPRPIRVSFDAPSAKEEALATADGDAALCAVG